MYIHIYTPAWLNMIIVIPIIPDTCLIQHVCASACACMFTLSTASSDAPSSTSTRTVAVSPSWLDHSNAVLPPHCEHSPVITVQRSIGLDEREHAHEYIHKHTAVNTCVYTHVHKRHLCVVDTLKKKCM